MLSGVPQGSVLGPVLFLLHFNCVTDMVTKDCDLSMYADDNPLFCEIRKLGDYSHVRERFDLVYDWFGQWFMDFNISKCKFMIISRKKSKFDHLIQLYMNGISIERVSEYKHLGVWLSDT